MLLPIGRTSARTTPVQHRRGRAGHLNAPALSQLTSFCPAPSKHLGKPANGSPGRADQRGAAPGPACSHLVRCGCALRRQARPARVWCARTHTQAPVHRDACGRFTRNLRSCPPIILYPVCFSCKPVHVHWPARDTHRGGLHTVDPKTPSSKQGLWDLVMAGTVMTRPICTTD